MRQLQRWSPVHAVQVLLHSVDRTAAGLTRALLLAAAAAAGLLSACRCELVCLAAWLLLLLLGMLVLQLLLLLLEVVVHLVPLLITPLAVRGGRTCSWRCYCCCSDCCCLRLLPWLGT
jgi:hypothetical protein